MISLSKKFTRYLIIAIFVTVSQSPLFSANYYSSYGAHSGPSVSDIITKTYQLLGLNDSVSKKVRTQTLAYLDRKELREHVNNCYRHKLKSIGADFFRNLFKSIIKNEIDFAQNYRAFYHGQKREFILLQDLYNGLYSITYKKKLRDFIILRAPNKAYSTFKKITDFLRKCIKTGDIKKWDFDELPHIKKFLLAVNPSLFGNSLWSGECTFHYFINSSNASYVNVLQFVEEVFDSFNHKTCFSRHRDEIQQLNSLLSEGESGKTGTLLQIFIPEKLVNSIAYRCKAWGLLYYDDQKPEQHPASKDLDDYKKTAASAWSSFGNNQAFDRTQFRLLINEAMLDANSGVKMFRFCNKTHNMKTYKTKLKQLLNTISAELK